VTPFRKAAARPILAVDDEPLIRMALAEFLEDEGFVVFMAGNADHAIAILEANPSIEVVATDVQMPGSLDGLKLAHVVRERWPPTILIVVSEAAKVEQSDLPADATFLREPVDPRRINGRDRPDSCAWLMLNLEGIGASKLGRGGRCRHRDSAA
jgi:CheY-like chemotaxis protein